MSVCVHVCVHSVPQSHPLHMKWVGKYEVFRVPGTCVASNFGHLFPRRASAPPPPPPTHTPRVLRVSSYHLTAQTPSSAPSILRPSANPHLTHRILYILQPIPVLASVSLKIKWPSLPRKPHILKAQTAIMSSKKLSWPLSYTTHLQPSQVLAPTSSVVQSHFASNLTLNSTYWDTFGHLFTHGPSPKPENLGAEARPSLPGQHPQTWQSARQVESTQTLLGLMSTHYAPCGTKPFTHFLPSPSSPYLTFTDRKQTR